MVQTTNESLCGGGVCNDHSVLQMEQTIVNDRDASSPVQWHQRLLLNRSFLSRAATLNFDSVVDEEDLIFVGASAAQCLYFKLLSVRTAITIKNVSGELLLL